jgi:hypothetical protein
MFVSQDLPASAQDERGVLDHQLFKCALIAMSRKSHQQLGIARGHLKRPIRA